MHSQLYQQVWRCQRWMQRHLLRPVLRECHMSEWCVPIMRKPNCLQRGVREPSVGSEQLRDVRHELRERAGVLRRPVRLHRKHTERHDLHTARTDAGDLLGRGVRPSRILLGLQHRR